MSQSGNRVVVTGMGVISPLGLNVTTTWEALIAGRSGIGTITLFDASSLPTRIAGEVKGFDPTDYMERKESRRMDRFAQMAVAASREALKQASLQINPENQDCIGIVVGSGIGGLTTLYEQIRVLLEKGPDRVSPFLVPMMISDMAAAQISIALGIKGPNLCVTSACSSGSDAIGAAYKLIKEGSAVAMFAGGAESIINPIGIASFSALKAVSARNGEPERASRPFDAERDGFVISEGSAILVLENLEFARKRGAAVLAELIGYGASGDAYHITQPEENGNGAARAMLAALGDARIAPSEVDYINAHGTSTQMNDRVETSAIKAVFGERAYKVPVSSTKSMTGHLIGGAAALEAVISILTIRNGIIPPTVNLTHPDPECDLDYVPLVARKAEVDRVMSNSFGFGGHNSVLVFSRYAG